MELGLRRESRGSEGKSGDHRLICFPLNVARHCENLVMVLLQAGEMYLADFEVFSIQ